MHAPQISFFDWQRQFATEEACIQHLAQLRWPNGFQCPSCGHDHGCFLQSRQLYECTRCGRQTSVTAGTLLHATKLPLTKWFWAIYWIAADKGSLSALRLTKLIGVSWPTAFAMLRKLRQAMGHRDTLYRLSDIIELDDAFLGGKRPGKRGRGAAGKRNILVACETFHGRPGFAAMETVAAVDQKRVRDFAHRRITPGVPIRTDALPALNSLSEQHLHRQRVTPPEQASQWLPWVHIVISNLKRFLLGTYHGISHRYVQEYLNEFTYRFNRRFWEPEIPNRLLRLCVEHVPVQLRMT
jgi:transposase-like protein